MPATSVDDLFAQLATLTHLNPDEWRDFLSCTTDQQLLIAKTYKDADWVKSPDVFAKVLEVLLAIGTVAGVATNVAGAVGAIKGLV